MQESRELNWIEILDAETKSKVAHLRRDLGSESEDIKTVTTFLSIPNNNTPGKNTIAISWLHGNQGEMNDI